MIGGETARVGEEGGRKSKGGEILKGNRGETLTQKGEVRERPGRGMGREKEP